jgi:transcriptional regulator with XRE-family HTH domain
MHAAIAKYLADNGITQTHLSKKTGIGQVTLNQTLNGKRKLPAEEYVLICRALNVPLDKFTPKEV